MDQAAHSSSTPAPPEGGADGLGPPQDDGVAPVGAAAPNGGPGPDQTKSLRLGQALELLADCLSDLRERGATPTAAGLKVTMLRQSGGAFREGALGFRSFRSFLALAQTTGLIALSEREGDVLVHPTNEAPTAQAISQHKSPARVAPTDAARTVAVPPSRLDPGLPEGAKVRPDLWAATLDFSPSAAYHYDRVGDRAWRLPAVPQEDEPEALVALRRRLAERPADFLPTPRVDADQQLEWMQSFTERLANPDWRTQLELALSQERPLNAFAAAVRGDEDLHRAWRETLLRAVVARLREWTALHGLQVEIFHRLGRPPGSSVPTGNPGAGSYRDKSPSSPEDDIRAIILAALARMPLADLLRLPIPAEALLTR